MDSFSLFFVNIDRILYSLFCHGLTNLVGLLCILICCIHEYALCLFEVLDFFYSLC